MSEQSPAKSPMRADRPDQEWVRGRCPLCDEVTVSNAYWVEGRGYILVWECWGSMADPPTCDYRRVL
jgi:hypothetical protein